MTTKQIFDLAVTHTANRQGYSAAQTSLLAINLAVRSGNNAEGVQAMQLYTGIIRGRGQA